MFSNEKFTIYNNQEFLNLRQLYTKLEKYIECTDNAKIHIPFGISFNNYSGDTANGIKWTWAINTPSIGYFDDFLKSTGFYTNIKELGIDDVHIRGASFITINEQEIFESDFHLDVMTRYDLFNLSTEILTIIFPLFELDDNMGNLEYKDGDTTKIYKYKTDEMLVWDACKFEHRTQPYSLKDKKKRILVSINLSTNDQHAKLALDRSTIHQGNLFPQLSKI